MPAFTDSLTGVPDGALIAELSKRRIGREGAEPAPPPPDHRDGKAADWRLANALTELTADIKRMEADPHHSPAALARHKKARLALERELEHIYHPEAATEREARHARQQAGTSDGEQAVLAKAEHIRKSDPSMSSAEAFRQAMRDPEILAAYYRESGTQPPPASTRPALAKADAGPSQSDVDAVGARADELVKSEGLSASKAYARALAESGVAYAA